MKLAYSNGSARARSVELPKENVLIMTRRRVVVVSPQLVMRRTLRTLLHDAGYLVTFASDTEELLEQVGRSFVRSKDKDAHDVIVFDARGDSQAIQTLHQVGWLDRPHALIGIIDEGDRDAENAALLIGAFAVFSVPFDAAKLLEAVVQVAPPYEVAMVWH